MAVTRDDLGGDWLTGKAELVGDEFFNARVGVGEGADGTGDGADRDLLARRHQTRAVAGEFGIVAGEFDAEAGGLGVDAVAAADGEGVLELKGAQLQFASAA